MSLNISAWLNAFRLRTLPLAFSAIIVGSFLNFEEKFDAIIFSLALTTTLLLQILSNLANDYGDSKKGTDNEDRIGPKRAIQSGALSFSQVKKAMTITAFLSLFSGLSLLVYALEISLTLLLFFILGLSAIAAAIFYTVGKKAYGYYGFGDLFVFLFFGIIGVMGSAYLQFQTLNFNHLYMAFSIGFFSVTVLNLNNMRDRESDIKANKMTLAAKLGKKGAMIYHLLLILGGVISAAFYIFQTAYTWSQYLPCLVFPIFILIMYKTEQIENLKDFDPFLKYMALSTFIFSILFMVSNIIVN
jgi:1,4-dihydroxy-2-naphthoate octaprenyltransferase